MGQYDKIGIVWDSIVWHDTSEKNQHRPDDCITTVSIVILVENLYLRLYNINHLNNSDRSFIIFDHMKPNRSKRIPTSEFAKRHPRFLNCSTDAEYARLAEEIYDLIKDEMSFMDDEDIRNQSITLALYFEDIHSNTHQFETFTKLYHEMFGFYVPFYNSRTASDESAEIDAMRFILWLSTTQEHDETMLNPRNEGNKDIAVTLWEHWLSVKDDIRPNTELADHLYSEETQTDALAIKNVLIWLQYNSFLGRSFMNPTLEDDPYGISEIRHDSNDKNLLMYGIQSQSVFDKQSWPLSIKASRIYAEMIRIDMDDKDDEYAAVIEQMDATPFGIYQIIGTKGQYLMVKDFKEEKYNVRADSFGGDIKSIIKDKKYIAGSFFKYDGEWYSNGISAMIALDDYDGYKKKEMFYYDMTHNHVGQFDEFINKHDGNRLYFFANRQKLKEFIKNELGNNASELPDEFMNGPVMLFFEPNGQFTITDCAPYVKHPDNPFYKQHLAENDCLRIIARTYSCTADSLIYMIEHNYLPDALINDIRGKQYGRQTMQENIEFIARCCRRDIKSDKPFTVRNPYSLDEQEGLIKERYKTKFGYKDFVEAITEQSTIRSSRNKEWKVVSCSELETTLSDPKTGKKYIIPTKDLYEAHLELNENDIKIAALEPYVGKENAPAASALLYSVVGRGFFYNALRNMSFEDLLKAMTSHK